MKFGKCITIILFLQAIFTGGVFAASATYQFSGFLNSVGDSNFNTGLIGANDVYPNGIAAGTSFTVSMNLDGNLGALSGSIDFDIGGVYQGHMSIGGAASVCNFNSCTRYGDYNDPLYPRMSDVTLTNQTTAVTTNLPLSDLSGGELYAWINLQLDPNINKPAIATSLSDLPINSIHFGLSSLYMGTAYSPCPFCVEGYHESLINQGWELHGASSSLSAVPIPAAAWLLGSGLLGLAGTARRKVA